jgi:hypothetical protein
MAQTTNKTRKNIKIKKKKIEIIYLKKTLIRMNNFIQPSDKNKNLLL